MDTTEVKERLTQSVLTVLKEEFGLEKIGSNGKLADSVSEYAGRLAELIFSELAQKEFEFFSDPEANKDVKVHEVSSDNKLNELTGAQWLWFTKSVLRTSYPSILGHDLRKSQGGNKPPQLMQELIEFFTKPGEFVLDPFAGAGGTALGAFLANRDSINIELNPASINIYHQVCEQEDIRKHEFIEGDCREILPIMKTDTFDFIATDPPYSPELTQTMSGQANQTYLRQNRKSSYITYSEDPRDFSKLEDFESYFEEMSEVGRELLRVLKPNRYMAMILRDAYQNSRYIPTSSIIADRYSKIGWILKGEKIWYATGSRIRPYGYPNAFVPNIVHQVILIFRKE